MASIVQWFVVRFLPFVFCELSSRSSGFAVAVLVSSIKYPNLFCEQCHFTIHCCHFCFLPVLDTCLRRRRSSKSTPTILLSRIFWRALRQVHLKLCTVHLLRQDSIIICMSDILFRLYRNQSTKATSISVCLLQSNLPIVSFADRYASGDF